MIPSLSHAPSRRLAIILSHPIQYYGPWFRHIAACADIELRVFYLWEPSGHSARDPDFQRHVKWDIDLLSGYPHEFVPNVARDPGTHHFGGLNNPSLRDRLLDWSPDAILLFGYAYRTHLGLFRRPPAPIIFRGDSHLIDHAQPSWFKKTVLRWLYSRCDAVTYVGQANRHYFTTFGVPDKKLFFAPHCVDANRYVRTPEIDHAALALRNQLGLVGKTIVLFAGKFIPAKQPVAFLNAFLEIATPDTALVFVGDGPQRLELTALAVTRPDCLVRFLPFANQSEMPVRYALADIFVLPSIGLYETWGLAINEAMHLGVPCLVSNRVGCQQDLVTDSETGWVFPADQPGALASTLARALVAIKCDPTRIREKVASRIAHYTYDQATAGLRAALDSAFSSL